MLIYSLLGNKLKYLVLFLRGEGHSAVLGAYSYLWSQGSVLEGLKGPYTVLELNLGWLLAGKVSSPLYYLSAP